MSLVYSIAALDGFTPILRNQLIRDIRRKAQRRMTTRLVVRTAHTALPPGAIDVVRARAIAWIRGNALPDQNLPNLRIGKVRSRADAAEQAAQNRDMERNSVHGRSMAAAGRRDL